MKTSLITVLLFALSSAVAFADEVPPPEFKTPPLTYTNAHEIAYRWDNNRLKKVEDLLLIGNQTKKKLTFYVKTIGNNHHMCHVTGEAKSEAERYVFIYEKCKLEIQYDSTKATVSDIGGKCQQDFCGMIGRIQSEFKRK